jgi:hypothetical protein
MNNDRSAFKQMHMRAGRQSRQTDVRRCNAMQKPKKEDEEKPQKLTEETQGSGSSSSNDDKDARPAAAAQFTRQRRAATNAYVKETQRRQQLHRESRRWKEMKRQRGIRD